jgi:hypothetical protein
LLVYHKVRGDLHSFRFARQKRFVDENSKSHEIEDAENVFGNFYRSPLVGWGNWTSDELRDKMVNWHSSIKPSIGNKKFSRALEKAAGSFEAVPDFDPWQLRDDED